MIAISPPRAKDSGHGRSKKEQQNNPACSFKPPFLLLKIQILVNLQRPDPFYLCSSL